MTKKNYKGINKTRIDFKKYQKYKVTLKTETGGHDFQEKKRETLKEIQKRTLEK